MVANRRAVGDCSVETLLVRFPCEIDGVETGNAVLRDDVFGPSDSVVTLGNPDFSAVPSVEFACGPPVLCTTPVRGSGVVDASADDVVVNDGEPVPDGAVDTDDGSVVPVVPVEEVDELDEVDDEEPDDPLESDGSARATPGIVVTADPTPRATANAPTRPT